MTIDTKRFPALAYVAEADPGSLAVVFDHYVERYGEHPAPDLFAFGEKITAELAARDAEIRREAQAAVLRDAADALDDAGGVEIDAEGLRLMATSVELERELLRDIDLHGDDWKEVEAATNAEQVEDQ